MALLYFENLFEHRPDVSMKSTFYGLINFYQFIMTSKGYQENESAEKLVKWEFESLDDIGVWVRIIESKEMVASYESILKLFMDENNREVTEKGEPIADGCADCDKKSYQSEEIAEQVARESYDGKDQQGSVFKCPHGNGWHLPGGDVELDLRQQQHIRVIDRDDDNEKILLGRLPRKQELCLKPDTYTLRCQKKAIEKLQSQPREWHKPLLRLVESNHHAEWPPVPNEENVAEWFFLTDKTKKGIEQQKEFVQKALNTPDYMLLEGPPGSGKTTAICELILQLVKSHKRVMLCASTHVAVDNVLERLMDERNLHRDAVLPIRIGHSSKLSPDVEKWQLDEFIRTETKRLLEKLRAVGDARTGSQQELYDQLQNPENTTIQEMILNAANLVCGTTVGILQHPYIKENKDPVASTFDCMIIDEASKTTFQEFLIPAMWAKKWVLVGDWRQLSPYVDGDTMAANIDPCLPDKFKRDACIDVFKASQKTTNKLVASLVCTGDQEVVEFYKGQAKSVEVESVEVELIAADDMNHKLLPYAALTIGSSEFIENNIDKLALDIANIRDSENELPDVVKRRVAAWCQLSGKKPVQWSSEIAWRLARLYEQRMNGEDGDSHGELAGRNQKKLPTKEKLNKEIELLLPHQDEDERNEVLEKIDLVKRVAFPSILELLQVGFDRHSRQKRGNAISDGLPSYCLENRMVQLKYQQRMHPDIAKFPREHIYNGEALITPSYMREEREWGYSDVRSVWVDVGKCRKNKSNANPKEAEQMMKELSRFDEWARKNPKDNRRNPWEVAVLCFYRGQEKELRKRLQKWSGSKHLRHHSKGDYLKVQVCTVDRFQGHEADMVLLSFTNHHATSFLECVNRLNVAITRARYQLKIFGNKDAMKKADGALGALAEINWEKYLGENYEYSKYDEE